MSPRRPTAALLFLHFPLEESFRHSFGTSIIISAFTARGVIQTLVWHQYYYSAFFRSRSHSDTRLAPSILFWYIFIHMCASWFFLYISWRMYDHLLNLEYVWYIIPVFLMFASTFKRTHWLVPGYCLGQIPCLEISIAVTTSEPTRWRLQPREDRSYPGQLFLWEMESHRRWWSANRLCHQPLETNCCTHRPEWSCTSYFVFCLEFL